MKKQPNTVQKWSFIVGLIIAVIAGFFINPWVPLVLFVLGIIVGFLNIEESEVITFLVAVIALGAIGSSSISVLSPILRDGTPVLESIVNNIIAFVGAAGLVVAIKAIIAIGKD